MKKVTFVASGYEVSNAMAGVGLRIWELAQVLASEFAITILTPTRSDLEFPGITFVTRDNGGWLQAIEQSDAVVFYDMPDTSMLLFAHRLGKQIVCENAPPFEHLEYRSIRYAEKPDVQYTALVDAFKLQVFLSDHFIARSSVERAGVLAALALCGRLNYINYDVSATLDHLVSHIPVAFNRHSDAIAEAAMPTLEPVDYVWNGGIWDYYDPTSVVKAVGKLSTRGVPLCVRFMYMPPHNQEIVEAQSLTTVIRELDLNEQVAIHRDFIPHQSCDGVVRSNRAIICIGKPGIENQTCHRFRLRDVFLYRMPIIIDRHGASGDLVRQFGIGLIVDGRDIDELADAMHRLVVDQQLYEQCVTQIDTVRNMFTYEDHIDGLVRFLRDGRRAPDIGTLKHHQAVTTLLNQRSTLEQPPVYPF